MKTRLRSSVAAMMLLIPGAATLTAFPAGAQPAATARALSIQSIALNADDGLSPGSVLQFHVQGTPGARAGSVTLAGSDITVPLRADRPGSYRGSYTVRRVDRIDPTRALQARLTYGDQTVTRSFSYPAGFQALAAPAPAPVARAERPGRAPHDDRAPAITGLTPPNGDRVDERGRVFIAADLADEGSGIDPDSVRIRIGGHDVTEDARVSASQVAIRENLPPGRHPVEVTVRDHAGNRTTKTWSFDVVERERRDDRYGTGPMPGTRYGVR